MFVKREKVKMAEVEEMRTNVWFSLYHTEKFEKLKAIALPIIHNGELGCANTERLTKLGKPSVVMRGYDSYPGVWVIDDTTRPMTWVIWSDGMHKHPWKGTSVEVIFPDGISGDELYAASEDFFTFFGIL